MQTEAAAAQKEGPVKAGVLWLTFHGKQINGQNALYLSDRSKCPAALAQSLLKGFSPSKGSLWSHVQFKSGEECVFL